MDFMLALNVTIYGLGIVFLALLVLMFSIMVLGKLFEAVTGKEVFTVAPAAEPRQAASQSAQAEAAAPAPGAAAPAAAVEGEPATQAAGQVIGHVTAPLPGKILSVSVKAGDAIRAGDDVCVIEAMKMGNSIKSDYDGIVAEVLVSAGDAVTFGAPLVAIASKAAPAPGVKPAGAPAAPPVKAAPPAGQPAPAAPAREPAAPVVSSSFSFGVEGRKHQAQVAPGLGGGMHVAVDGQAFQASRDPADPNKVLVNGRAHSVEIREPVGGKATVVVDGAPFRVNLEGTDFGTGSAPTAPAFAPGSFKIDVGARQHLVELKDVSGASGSVLVDGASYKIERGKANDRVVVVNGKPFVVEVRERTGDSVGVLVDGQPHSVRLVEAKAVAASAVAAAVPAQPAAPVAAKPAAAPAPAAAVAAPAPAPTRPAAAGERVTAPLPGKIISVAVKPGDSVRKGDELCVIEAMKMGNSIKAQQDGTIEEVLVSPGSSVAFGTPLFVIR